MAWLQEPTEGDPITAEWGRMIVRAINRLMEDGPEVCAPLAKVGGAIYLGQDYQLYEAITTETIPARSGSQWGSGGAYFLTADVDGLESPMIPSSGGATSGQFTAWNWTGGAITTVGTRIWVAWAYDKWVIIAADCSTATGS